MALVTSAKDITVIILNNDEAKSLSCMLTNHVVHKGRGCADLDLWLHLDELANAMLDEKMAFAYDEETTDIDREYA